MVSLLESLVGFIEVQKTEFEHYEMRGIIMCGHAQYNSVLKQVRVPNNRYVDVGDKDENRNMSPMDKFRQDVIEVINNQLISDLKYRLKLYKEIKMYEILHTQNLTRTFPNIEIALQIYLSLMVSNCSGKRSFSKLKRIKNELRNRIRQDRLNSLSIMSIESDVLRQLYFSQIILDFSNLKSRKMPI